MIQVKIKKPKLTQLTYQRQYQYQSIQQDNRTWSLTYNMKEKNGKFSIDDR